MELKQINYDKAKEEADKIDKTIVDVLCSGKSFRVEAGAGSGKTYSLNKIIEWIQDNKWDDFSVKKKKLLVLLIPMQLLMLYYPD